MATLTGTSGDDTLVGGSADDFLYGLAGNDILHGGTGSDFADGGSGDDLFLIYDDSGTDVLIGGTGIDTADFELSVDGDGWVLTSSNGTEVTALVNSTVITMSEIENFETSFGDDVIDLTLYTGTAGGGSISAGQGDDTIFGSAAGGDSYYGGGGNDTLHFGADGVVQQLFGGNGTDVFVLNNSSLDLSSGAIFGGSGTDTVLIDAESGGVTFDTRGLGIDQVEALSFADRGTGFDVTVILEDTGFDSATGDGWSPALVVTGNDKTGSTEVLRVTLVTVDSFDMSGWSFIDWGGQGERIEVTGDAGDEVITGSVASDRIDGGAGSNTIDAGAGDDTVRAGAGDDTLFGGAGLDWISYDGASGAISVGMAAGTVTGAAGSDLIGGFEALTGTAFGDTIDLSGSATGMDIYGGNGADRLTGSDDGDMLDGGFSNDTLHGGDGRDLLEGGYGNDIIDGGAGVDGAVYDGFGGGITVSLLVTTAQDTGAGGIDTITNIEDLWGGSFNDTFTGTTGDNSFRMQSGSDKVYGLGGDDIAFGGAGNDTLVMGAGEDFARGNDGIDVILAGAGADRLEGNDGNDQLRGGDDGDTLTGGIGRDVLIGGDFVGGGFPGDGAADLFVFLDVAESAPGGATRDIIRDFEVGLDRIDLSAIDAEAGSTGTDEAFGFVGTAGFTGTEGELRYFNAGSNTVVRADIDGDGSADLEIFLNGVLTLTADDFVL